MAFQIADYKAHLLPALIDWHAAHNGARAFNLNLIDGAWHTTTHAEFARLVSGAATALSGAAYKALPLRRAADGGEPPYVTVLASSDVTSLAVYMGVMKRGCAIFPVTPRAPPEAIVAMLGKLQCKHLLYTPQHAKLAASVQALLQEQGDASAQLTTFALAPTTDAVAAGAAACNGIFPYDFQLADEANKPCVVFTTSGSTGFPKVCPYTHRHMLWSGAAVNPCLLLEADGSAVKYTESERILVPPPLFHFMGWGMGVLACLLGPVTKVTPPPGPPPNAAALIELVRTHKCRQALLVPSQLDELSLDPAAVATLAGLRRVWYGGAPISQVTLERLQSAGVRLCTAYGSTDIGAMGMTAQDCPREEEGLWMELRGDMDYEFDPVSVDEHGTRLYEIVVKTTEEIGPILEQTPGINRSGDLCALHPTRKNTVNLRGRRGDLVILSNGENVATLPVEHAATSHPWISHAMVFGHGRPQAGVLIQLRAAHADKSADEVCEALMPTLEAVNAKSPDYAKIFPNMIVVAKPDKPLFVSDKNSIQTGRTLALYKDEIDAAYDEKTDKPAAASLTSLERAELQRFLSDSVARVLDVDSAKLSPTTPLQDAGLDSLRATMIRRSVVAGLKEAQAAGLTGENGAKPSFDSNSLSSSFAFDGLTLEQLTNLLDAFVNRGGVKVDTIEEQVSQAKAMLEKYAPKPISSERAAKPHANGTSGTTILVTGTTGGLGCALLELLERDASVARIICLNRAAAAGADGKVLAGKERQAEALERRGLSSEIAGSAKIEYIDGSDVELKKSQLPEKLDIVLHSAWPVRFDLPLASFENSVAGAHNLLELSRELGARFVFISSVGTVMNAAALQAKDGEETFRVVEAERAELEYAMGGYGGSKSVVERLISSAVHSTPGFEAFSIRSGQLMGDERTGSWNAHEWWPRIVRSAAALGLLPESYKLGALDWLTINDAARAIVGMTLAPRGALQAATSASSENVVNFIHPKTIASAAEIFQPLLAGPPAKLVPLSEWLVALRKLQDSQEAKDDFAALNAKVPALSLIDTYEGMESVRSSTVLQAGEAAAYLKDAKVLDGELAAKFVQYWGVGRDSDAKQF